MLWHNLRFVGPALGSTGYFLFAAAYTSRPRWFRRRRLAGLFVVPALTVGLVWTNPVHALVRASVDAAATGPFVASIATVDDVDETSRRTDTIDVEIDGNVRYYDVSVSPITDPAESGVGRVIVFSEVTSRVERRRRLQEQKERLERHNDRLDRFSSMVSHDLPNPLTTASGYLETARQTGRTPGADLDVRLPTGFEIDADPDLLILSAIIP